MAVVWPRLLRHRTAIECAASGVALLALFGAVEFATMAQRASDLPAATTVQAGPPALVGRIATPAVSPDGSRVAFVRRTEGVGAAHPVSEMWMVDIDGRSTLWRASVELAVLNGLGWSPDSTRIALAGVDERRACRLAILDATSGRVELLPPSAAYETAAHPEWDPQGTWIAFTRRSDAEEGGANVWIVRPDGTGLRRITERGGDISFGDTHWSTDGSLLYCVQTPEASPGGDVYGVPIASDGGAPSRLTRRGDVRWACVAPDRRRLLCCLRSSPEPPTPQFTILPLPLPQDAGPVFSTWSKTAFSPDSQWVSYASGGPSPQTARTLCKAPSSDPARCIILADGADGPASGAWTARGQIVFTRGSGRSLWVVSDDASGEACLVSLVGANE